LPYLAPGAAACGITLGAFSNTDGDAALTLFISLLLFVRTNTCCLT